MNNGDLYPFYINARAKRFLGKSNPAKCDKEFVEIIFYLVLELFCHLNFSYLYLVSFILLSSILDKVGVLNTLNGVEVLGLEN